VLGTTPITIPPPPTIPSTVSTPVDTDRLMIDQLSSWFGSIHISSSVARRYAELLVEKNSGSISKLQRKLERKVNYLEEIGGFDEDDIIDIKEGLIKKNNSNGSGTDNSNGRNTSSPPPPPPPPPPGFPLESQEIIKPVNSIFPEATVIDSQKNFLKKRRIQFMRQEYNVVVIFLRRVILGRCIQSPGLLLVIRLFPGHMIPLLKYGTGNHWNY
jgi:hypothetical protein